MNLTQLKTLLGHYNIRPDKKLGQNFLISEEILDRIIDSSDVGANDTVLEIGPGLGVLTEKLSERAGRVVAVEKDKKLVRVLEKIFKGRKNVEIIENDILKTNLTDLVTSAKSDIFLNFKVVANIPYYITGMVLQKLLAVGETVDDNDVPEANGSLEASITMISRDENVAETFSSPSLIVLMLQKEVAERIVAKPGDMSILSISVQMFADPEIVFNVPKENFYPVPEVDSAIVKITPLSSPLNKTGDRLKLRYPVDVKKFFQIVKMGFSSKRKQLHNNLQAYLDTLEQSSTDSPLKSGTQIVRNEQSITSRNEIKKFLESLGLNPLARAQDLSLEDWVFLYRKIEKIQS